MSFTRTNEGGSVVSFAIIALVLSALVIGGIFVVQKSGEPKPSPTNVAKSPTPPASSSDSPRTTPSKTPAVPQSPAPTKSPAKQPPIAQSTPLPQTGPEDGIVHILMLALLAGVTISYIQSHRARVQFLELANR